MKAAINVGLANSSILNILLFLTFSIILLISETSLASIRDDFKLNFNAACGDTINTSTTLNGNLNCAADGLIIGADNIVLDCTGFSLTGSGSGTGISSSSRNNITIKNCVVQNFSTNINLVQTHNSIVDNNRVSNSNIGIQVDASNDNEISNNTATASSYGIYILFSNRHNVLNNRGTSQNDVAILFFETKNTTIDNSHGTSITSVGIALGSNSDNSILKNSVGISSSNTGFSAGSTKNLTLVNVSGISDSGAGLVFQGVFAGTSLIDSIGISSSNLGMNIQSINGIFINITGKSSSSSGVRFNAGGNNMIFNSTMESNTGIALEFSDSPANTFFDTTLRTNNIWMSGNSNPMTRTKFDAPDNGSIIIIPPRNPLNPPATVSDIYITKNKAFFNISKYPNYNVSAEITLHGIGFSDPKPTVDFEDDGSFNDCPPDICMELGFAEGTYKYNVTHFTTYSSRNETTVITCGTTIISDTVLTSDFVCSGDGLTIGANNLVLDCNGFSFRGSGTGTGINNNGFNGITVKNCILINFTNGIKLDDADNNMIDNNTAVNNFLGMVLNNSDNNIIANNTARLNSDSGIQLIAYSRGNVLSNNDLTNNRIRSVYIFPDIANRLYECHNTIDSTNPAGSRNKPVLYYHDTGNVNVKDQLDIYGQIIFCNISSSFIENVSVVNGSAIELMNSVNNSVNNIQAIGNTGVGFLVWYSNNNSITNSKLLFAGDDNINLCGSNYNLIENNTFRGGGTGGHEGIHIYEASGFNIIRNNNIQFQSISGIAINDYTTFNTNGCSNGGQGTNNVIDGNIIANNGINLSVGTFGDGITLGGVDFTNVTNNMIINNRHSGINMFGSFPTFSSDNNLVSGNTINNNNLAAISQVAGIAVGGIGITDSNSETINSNTVCYNNALPLLDFNMQNSGGNSGMLNTCNNPGNWDDGVVPPGCTFTCPPAPNCVTPYDDLYIMSSTQICAGNYNISDFFSEGVVIINSNNVVLDCNNAVFGGSGKGTGIFNPGLTNVTIQNCNVQNYGEGIKLKDALGTTVNNNYVCFNQLDFSISNSIGNSRNGNTCDRAGSWNDYGTAGCTSVCTLNGVNSSTGTGAVFFSSNYGSVVNLTAVNESSLPSAGKPNITFQHGFFSFNLTGLSAGQTVTVRITYPSNISNASEYWKYGPTPTNAIPSWYNISVGSNDGDSIITINLTDGGFGDHDLLVNGLIEDPGGLSEPGTCGDINNDSQIDVVDVVLIVNIAFRGAAPPDPPWIADINGDGIVSDIIDVIGLINHAFRGQPAPAC